MILCYLTLNTALLQLSHINHNTLKGYNPLLRNAIKSAAKIQNSTEAIKAFTT